MRMWKEGGANLCGGNFRRHRDYEEIIEEKGTGAPLLWRDLYGKIEDSLYRKEEPYKGSYVSVADSTLRPQWVLQAMDRDRLETEMW